MKILVDTHTHTIASDHAYSTVLETAAAAARAKINACVSVEDFDRVFDELLAFLGGHEQEG